MTTIGNAIIDAIEDEAKKGNIPSETSLEFFEHLVNSGSLNPYSYQFESLSGRAIGCLLVGNFVRRNIDEVLTEECFVTDILLKNNVVESDSGWLDDKVDELLRHPYILAGGYKLVEKKEFNGNQYYIVETEPDDEGCVDRIELYSHGIIRYQALKPNPDVGVFVSMDSSDITKVMDMFFDILFTSRKTYFQSPVVVEHEAVRYELDVYKIKGQHALGGIDIFIDNKKPEASLIREHIDTSHIIVSLSAIVTNDDATIGVSYSDGRIRITPYNSHTGKPEILLFKNQQELKATINYITKKVISQQVFG